MRRTRDFTTKFLVVFFLLVGLSICGYWGTQLSSGFLPLGVNTISGDSYIIWHVIAELIAGIITIIAAFLLLTRNALGHRLGLFSCGMLLYTGLSSIGWGILHDPGLLALFIITSLGSLFGFFALIGREEL
jgi:hypothetical protein